MTACPELLVVRLVEMSDPLNLLDLAAQSLRNEKASAVRALEELPVGLFPTLSTAAFDGGHTKTVTAMVQAWPPSGTVKISVKNSRPLRSRPGLSGVGSSPRCLAQEIKAEGAGFYP
ncbi:Oog2 [Vulpes lagopus]